jgi:hypothetical protein
MDEPTCCGYLFYVQAALGRGPATTARWKGITPPGAKYRQFLHAYMHHILGEGNKGNEKNKRSCNQQSDKGREIRQGSRGPLK